MIIRTKTWIFEVKLRVKSAIGMSQNDKSAKSMVQIIAVAVFNVLHMLLYTYRKASVGPNAQGTTSCV